MLALLGILVGTASVVAMVSGGELAANEALRQFKTLGTDLLAVSINDSLDQDNKKTTTDTLNLNTVYHLGDADEHILDIAPYTQVFNPLLFNGHELHGSILGVTDSFAHIIHIDVARGRFISLLDGYALFCVIGDKLYEEMKHISLIDPIGQQIQLGKDYYTIVGVLKSWPENSFVYANIDYTILIPILSSTAMSKYASINNIILRLAPNVDTEKVQANITRYVEQHAANKRLFYRSAKELVARMTKQSQILTVFLGLIGSISLLVGGIGVMNIMLVSVVERKREIGIRLAVGANRSNIRTLFLIEAIVLSLAGGTLGVLIGILIAYVMALGWHWHFTFFIWPPLIGFSVSVATGIFFGYYPAYKASQLDPIQALRSEGP
jgi:putative ABC transport system permease protein